ncbi:MAG: hypothetical protein ACI97P_001170, partial [Arcticibacterium sp.]
PENWLPLSSASMVCYMVSSLKAASSTFMPVLRLKSEPGNQVDHHFAFVVSQPYKFYNLAYLYFVPDKLSF